MPFASAATTTRLRAGRRRRIAGQALAEFAIAFPLQLFLAFGILQLGLIFFAEIMVNYASFKAARAAAVEEDAARAAVIVLAPLTGRSHNEQCDYRIGDDGVPRHSANCADYGPGVTLPGWGFLRGSDLGWGGANGGKVRVFVNGVLLRPDTSWSRVVDSDAYDDDARFGGARDGTARRALLDALDQPLPGQYTDDVHVIVEFDYELVFPVVDAFWATFFRGRGTEDKAADSGDADGEDARMTFGDLDQRVEPRRTSIYEPGQGYRTGAARVREVGGARHLVIARECVFHRGFAPPSS